MDLLREIAFVLLARAAVVELRTTTAYAELPPKLPLVLSSSLDRTYFGRSTWVSSAQTRIEFAYIDGAAIRKTGSFTWPDAADWVDDYVDELLIFMEAGLVKGCAPAKLPPPEAIIGQPAKVSPIDASASTLKKHYEMLEDALEQSRGAACRGAK